MSFQRAVSYLRDVSAARAMPCVGCEALTATYGTWSICTTCFALASAWITDQTSEMPGWEQRAERRSFWRSKRAVKAALVEARIHAGVTA